MNRLAKAASIAGLAVLCLFLAVFALAHILQVGKTVALADDYGAALTCEPLSKPVSVEGVRVIEQDVSCGYAVIEMFGGWAGSAVSEEDMMGEYGTVVTSTGPSFCDEMNKRFPDFDTSMRAFLPHSELLAQIHESLDRGIPVPIEWAAPFRDSEGVSSWTLHYSLVTGMNASSNEITVANPYGYSETIAIDEFLARTSFAAFEDMPLWMQLAFDFGVFERNAVFIAQPLNGQPR